MAIADFETPIRYEPLSLRALRIIRRLRDIDPSRGCGVLGNDSRCVWTRDGHRITFWVDRVHGYGGSVSKVVDPLADTVERGTRP
jgi:hypothetical protein